MANSKEVIGLRGCSKEKQQQETLKGRNVLEQGSMRCHPSQFGLNVLPFLQGRGSSPRELHGTVEGSCDPRTTRALGCVNMGNPENVVHSFAK